MNARNEYGVTALWIAAGKGQAGGGRGAGEGRGRRERPRRHLVPDAAQFGRLRAATEDRRTPHPLRGEGHRRRVLRRRRVRQPDDVEGDPRPGEDGGPGHPRRRAVRGVRVGDEGPAGEGRGEAAPAGRREGPQGVGEVGRHLRQRRRAADGHRRQGRRAAHQRAAGEGDRGGHVRPHRPAGHQLPHRAQERRGRADRHEAVHRRVRLLHVQGAGGKADRGGGGRCEGGRPAELAELPRAGRHGGGRRPAPAGRVRRQEERERAVEGGHPRPRPLVSSGVGRPRVRHHCDQREGAGPEAGAGQPRAGGRGRRRRQAHLAGDLPGPRHGEDPVDEDGPRGDAEAEAACEREPSELHGRHRWQARRRLLRHGGAVLLRLRRQAALEARPEHARLQLLAGQGVRVGVRQLARCCTTACASSRPT